MAPRRFSEHWKRLVRREKNTRRGTSLKIQHIHTRPKADRVFLTFSYNIRWHGVNVSVSKWLLPYCCNFLRMYHFVYLIPFILNFWFLIFWVMYESWYCVRREDSSAVKRNRVPFIYFRFTFVFETGIREWDLRSRFLIEFLSQRNFTSSFNSRENEILMRRRNLVTTYHPLAE
jgi:hypothetical protein